MTVGPKSDPTLSGAIEQLKEIAREAEQVRVSDQRWPQIMERRIPVVATLTACGESAVGPLVSLLEERGSVVALFAAEALGLLREPAAVTPLLSAFVRELNPVYTKAIARIGAPGAVEPLIVILENADSLAEEAAEQLRTQGWLRQPKGMAASLGRTLHKAGIIPANASIRNVQARLIRKSVAEALGLLGDTRAAGPLRRIAGDRDPSLRESVAEALRRIGAE